MQFPGVNFAKVLDKNVFLSYNIKYIFMISLSISKPVTRTLAVADRHSFK